ncbi:putative l-fucose permease protein [Lasiodiplodia theobromae]|uniref:Glucose/galactose transporter n=1 Tax=Lasiodiplodia theobromae TaxID=45133 RepID=A0A5N5CX18_9PEZI|nr:L-fucose permease protein [Lasiodiplodia theobromae]KAB2569856.1 Glucose/galactose transporter [Lasiodiplodia theobromae]KAF4536632.1 L-fucose permease protein [Lasiodiplodia theobromae]KAF9634439.1 putative l-fucose permease protein [Lasiodiplodia theobromae]
MGAFFQKLMANRSGLKAGNQKTKASELTVRESLLPLFLVTILYFLWGFAYGLLDTLNKHFQVTLDITRARSAGLQGAYFGAYPLASLGFANWTLRHYGYKATFMLGLILYGIGALCMWPAGLNRSFGGFCGATVVIGSGLGSLETAANPFMAVVGPPKYSELRINLAQAVQAVGTVVGPVLGSYVFFKNTGDDVDSLESVQWVYLAIGIFVFLLAGVFFFVYIPEVTDADMAAQVEDTHTGSSDKPFRKQYRLFHAAAAQWCYTGAQVAIATYFINYVTEKRDNTGAAAGANFLAGAQGCFAVGRFSGAILMRWVKPRWVFLAYLTGVVAFNAASIDTVGNTGLAMLMLTLFFESVCFPTIVALGIRGLGRHTKRGAGLIIAGVSGGAAVPAIMGAVADSRDDTGFAMIVPVMFFVLSWSYALCVNFVPAYRDPADKIGASKIGLEPKKDDEEAAAAGFDTADVLKADAKEIEVVGEGLSGKA